MKIILDLLLAQRYMHLIKLSSQHDVQPEHYYRYDLGVARLDLSMLYGLFHLPFQIFQHYALKLVEPVTGLRRSEIATFLGKLDKQLVFATKFKQCIQYPVQVIKKRLIPSDLPLGDMLHLANDITQNLIKQLLLVRKKVYIVPFPTLAIFAT